MKRSGSFYFVIVFMVIMLVFIGLSLGLESFQPKVLPIMIASIAFILTGIELRREILARDKPETIVTGDKTSSGEEDREGWHGYMVIGAWLVGFFLAIYLLGFIIAIPLFLLSYMKSHGTRWVVAVPIAILIPVFVYGIFKFALSMLLYPGLLFT